MDWKQAIVAWKKLPPEEKARRRWQRIPRNVAQSMAFEGEPVSLESLEALHACRPLPSSVAEPTTGAISILAGQSKHADPKCD